MICIADTTSITKAIACLVYRKVNFCLHISITTPAPEVKQPLCSLGVDLGSRRVAVTSDKKFHTAKNIRMVLYTVGN